MKEIVVTILSSINFTLFKIGAFRQEKRGIKHLIEDLHHGQFEGVKIIMGINEVYLISALSLPTAEYQNPSMMMRVAKAMAQSQASTFLNGSNITMDMVMSTSETETPEGVKSSTVTMIESIKHNAFGFVKALELLSNYEIDNGDRMHFIYMKKIEEEND